MAVEERHLTEMQQSVVLQAAAAGTSGSALVYALTSRDGDESREMSDDSIDAAAASVVARLRTDSVDSSGKCFPAATAGPSSSWHSPPPPNNILNSPSGKGWGEKRGKSSN